MRSRILLALVASGLTAAVAGAVAPASAAGTYQWQKGVIDGGGFANSVAVAPGGSSLLVGGDTWGEYASTDGAKSWLPTMSGVTGAFGAAQSRGNDNTDAAAVAFDSAGTKAYACTGRLAARGGFYAVDPSRQSMVPVAPTGAGSTVDGTAKHVDCTNGLKGDAIRPRSTGTLVSVVPKYGKDFIFAATNLGVLRSNDGGASWTTLIPAGSSTSGPCNAWSALTINGTALYAASFPQVSADCDQGTAPARVFRVGTAFTGAANTYSSVSVPAGTAPNVEDLTTVGTTTYAAAGRTPRPPDSSSAPYPDAGLYKVSGSSLVAVPSALDGQDLAAIAGTGSTLFAGTGSTADNKSVASMNLSSGAVTWLTGPPLTATNDDWTVYGTTRSWWLHDAATTSGSAIKNYLLGGSRYSVGQLALDPTNQVLYVAGGAGLYRYPYGASTPKWQPASSRMEGTMVRLIGPHGSAVCNDDGDYGAEQSSDRYNSISWYSPSDTDRCYDAGTHHTGKFPDSNIFKQDGTPITVTFNGDSYRVVRSCTTKPGGDEADLCHFDLTRNGTSIADTRFQAGAATQPFVLYVDAADVVYLGLTGGGVLVGTPG